MARNIQIIVIDPDPQSREEVRRMLALGGFAVLGCAAYGTEAFSLCQETHPDVVLMNLTEPVGRAFQTLEAVTRLLPASGIIIYSRISAHEVVRRAMQLGARDYLVQPVKQEKMAAAIESVRRLLEESPRVLPPEVGERPMVPFGSVVTVFGPKGGVGKTTLATNLAVALATHVKLPVAIVDLDLRFGDVATFFDLPVEHSIVDLGTHAGPVGLDTVRQYMSRHSSGVDVLPAPRWKGEWYTLTPDHVGSALHALARSYDFVLVDTPGGYNDLLSQALEVSTVALLVTTPDVPSIKDAFMALEILRSWSYPEERIQVVLNHPSPAIRVSPAEVKRVLGDVPRWQIPFDRAMAKAIQEGRPLVMDRPRSRAARALLQLAHFLAGQAPSAGGGGLLSRLVPSRRVKAAVR
ncbi:MAG: P-loop NTPase [Dehalococcoidia bacterium]|nr:P-loop NTPase [Dehalococcoidia bacterium]MDW8009850.1 P-loop NTPase [Chloroflexota bacterium]WBU15419.1 iron-sulfur cluster carrier protein [uncultured bacterium]